MLLCSFKTLLFAVANRLEIIATYVFHLSICTNVQYILQSTFIYWLFYLVHEYLLSSPRQGLYFVYLCASKHPARRSWIYTHGIQNCDPTNITEERKRQKLLLSTHYDGNYIKYFMYIISCNSVNYPKVGTIINPVSPMGNYDWENAIPGQKLYNQLVVEWGFKSRHPDSWCLQNIFIISFLLQRRLERRQWYLEFVKPFSDITQCPPRIHALLAFGALSSTCCMYVCHLLIKLHLCHIFGWIPFLYQVSTNISSYPQKGVLLRIT